MFNMVSYENLIADIYTPDRVVRYNYVLCSPPSRLQSKGTVVLLHDFFKSSYQFRHCIDIFASAGYLTIAPDFPGRTISKKSLKSSQISMRTLVSELSQFLHFIEIRRPVHFVGIGFGAHMATELAIQHSEVVASVTCCCEPHFAGDIRRLEHLLRIPTSASGKELRKALRQFFESTAELSEDDLAEYIEPFAQPGRLLDLQQASKTVLKSEHTLHESMIDCADLEIRCLLLQPPEKGIFIKGRHVLEDDEFFTSKNVNCDPEAHAESFAIAVLSYLDQIAKKEIVI